MKIVENTPERLVLRDLPLGPGLLLLAFALFPMLWGGALAHAGEPLGGLVLIGIGLILFVGCFGAFVRILTVRLDRRLGTAEISERSLFGRKRQSCPLPEITGATLQSTVIRRKPGDQIGRSSRRRPPEPRVWRAAFVRAQGGPLPLTEVYGSEEAATRAAAAINGWLGAG